MTIHYNSYTISYIPTSIWTFLKIFSQAKKKHEMESRSIFPTLLGIVRVLQRRSHQKTFLNCRRNKKLEIAT